MKRVVLTLVCLAVLSTLLVPAMAVATEAQKPKATTTAATATTATATTTEGQTGAVIVYPAPEPDVSAQEAYDSTEWAKPGDLMNLGVALLSLAAIAGIVIWGILATRKASTA